MLLAYKIERALTKDQILELYMNQIYLGERAYGFAAAARVYFGKDLKDITLARGRDARGLPKAPSAYNPVVNPKRAKIRQEYILSACLELRAISARAVRPGVAGRDSHAQVRATNTACTPEYIAEMVRQMMYAQYKRRKLIRAA